MKEFQYTATYATRAGKGKRLFLHFYAESAALAYDHAMHAGAAISQAEPVSVKRAYGIPNVLCGRFIRESECLPGPETTCWPEA